MEVINRVDDLSTLEDKNRKVLIESEGWVTYIRSYRIKSMLTLSLWDYPYDVQEVFYGKAFTDILYDLMIINMSNLKVHSLSSVRS